MTPIPSTKPILWALLALSCLFIPQSAFATDSDSTTLWITADIEGYLVGCDCPSGDSAGLSAMTVALEGRDPLSEALLDAGGFREPLRSDPLLEGYMDEAALWLDYTGMVAVSSDLRDGRRSLQNRNPLMNLGAAGAVEDRRFLMNIPGEHKALLLPLGDTVISVYQWAGAEEQGLLDTASGGHLTPVSSQSVHELLAESESDYRILVIRGGLGDFAAFTGGADTAAGYLELVDLVDFIVLTGPDSPAYELPDGGLSGNLQSEGSKLPWISLAPRGNGLARVTLSENQNAAAELISLKRGVAPESQRILAMGDSFMNDLIESALAAANRGKVKGRKSSSTVAALEAELEVTYWYPYGCRDCDDFLWNDIPAMERSSGSRVSVIEKDTGDPEDFDELLKQLEERGIELSAIPVMFIGDAVLQGDDEIKAGLEERLNGGLNSAAGNSGPERSAVRWEPGAIFLAGLLDGVNPCAFSAMVFLVSALAMAGRSRKTMLAIGMAYALGIFVTYSLIGAGLLGGLKRIAVESGMRAILEYILAAFLALLAILSLIDGYRLSRGRTDLLLKLPEKLSSRVHSLIRTEVRSGAAAGGALLLGAVVALIELGCTGQVYLPTIAWMIARGDGATPWLWLVIYNLAFIIPLLIVFAVSYKGVSAVKLAAVFRKRGAAVKYITAGLLAVLAVVILVA